MNILTKKNYPKYSYKDYIQWEGKWELIEGIPYAMSPAPNLLHQKISGNIHTLLSNLLKNCEKCIPLLPVDWKIDNYTILQPDNLVVGYPIEDQPYLSKPPSLIFEILSSSSEMKDKKIKFKIYEKQKVLFYVIIDPLKKIEIYKHNGKKYKKVILKKNSYIFDLIHCKIEFDFSKIW